jgi:hypothetical protein
LVSGVSCCCAVAGNTSYAQLKSFGQGGSDPAESAAQVGTGAAMLMLD